MDLSKESRALRIFLSFYNGIYEAADNDESNVIIYLDFSKAFDKVPHQRL